MTTYTAIANSEIDPDSPITTGLMTKIRDNPIALAEGASGAPAVDVEAITGSGKNSLTDGDVVNASGYKIVYREVAWDASTLSSSSYPAGDNLKSGLVDLTKVSGSAVTVFGCYVPIGGTFRVDFTLSRSAISNNTTGQVYRNGSAVGTLRQRSSSGTTAYSEDISGWSRGDLLEIRANGNWGQYNGNNLAYISTIKVKNAEYWSIGG